MLRFTLLVCVVVAAPVLSDVVHTRGKEMIDVGNVTTEPLLYLHIQKTGGTFCDSFLRVRCPAWELIYDIGFAIYDKVSTTYLKREVSKRGGAAAPERPVDPKLAAARRARRERAQARAAERDYQRSVEELTEGERREAARGEMGGALQQASIGVNLIAAIVTAGFVGHYAGAQLSRTGPHVSQAPPPLLLVLLLLLLAADWHHLTPSHPRHLPVHARACQRWRHRRQARPARARARRPAPARSPRVSAGAASCVI